MALFEKKRQKSCPKYVSLLSNSVIWPGRSVSLRQTPRCEISISVHTVNFVKLDFITLDNGNFHKRAPGEGGPATAGVIPSSLTPNYRVTHNMQLSFFREQLTPIDIPINQNIIDEKSEGGKKFVLVKDNRTKKEVWKNIDQVLGSPVLGPP